MSPKYYRFGLAALTLFLFTAGAQAQDRLIQSDGTVLSGQITGVSANQVQIIVDGGKAGFPLSLIKKVEMPMPKAIQDVKGKDPAQVIAVTEPILANYQGLPADWVVQAMVLVALAYSAENNAAQSDALFQQIKAMPGDNNVFQADLGLAQNAVNQKHAEEALPLLQPILDKARQSLAHSPEELPIYNQAFVLQGEALEAKGDFSGALTAYLTANIFDHGDTSNSLAQSRVNALRTAHPDVKVP